jgi:large subunit ribosomal protein L43
MATRGVFQLSTLRLYYCEHGGSSRAMRDFISNGRLTEWATKHPHVEMQVKPRNGQHPYIHADYLTTAAAHQVSVKNYEHWKYVQEICDMMHSRSGRKITKITTPVLTDTPSVQGVWTPFLNLQALPPFAVKIHDGSGSTGSGASEKVEL